MTSISICTICTTRFKVWNTERGILTNYFSEVATLVTESTMRHALVDGKLCDDVGLTQYTCTWLYIIYIHRNICWQYSITWCSYLQYNAFVNGKLCDDVGQQQVPVVLGGGVHTVLTEQAGPGERHQAPQLVTLFSGVKYRKCNNLIWASGLTL